MAKEMDVGRLVERHHAGVWRYLCYLGCDASLADDLTQETFIAVLKGDFVYRGPKAAAAYLRLTARRLFLNALRSRRAERRADVDVLELFKDSDDRRTERTVEAAEAVWAVFADDAGDVRLDALRACLETLEQQARFALEMRYRDEAAGAEIAHALGLSESAAKMILLRAKTSLRECVTRRLAL